MQGGIAGQRLEHLQIHTSGSLIMLCGFTKGVKQAGRFRYRMVTRRYKPQAAVRSIVDGLRTWERNWSSAAPQRA
jgi:hypothetical protein